MKYSVTCNLMPTPHKDGRYALRIRVSWDCQRVSHTLDNPIPFSEWDKENGQPLPSATKARKELNRLTAAVDDLFDLCHVERRIPSPEEVRSVLGEKGGRNLRKADKHNIVAAMEEFIRDNQHEGNWSDGSSLRWCGMRNKLKEWNSTISTEEVDEEAIRSFMDYLYGLGQHNTTVAKNVSWFKTFMRWCRRKGYATNSQWEDYHPRFKGNGDERDIVYLTQEELCDIIALDLSQEPCLDRVRDTFLFCCFTGLRHSDAVKLRQADVHGDYISVVTKKTSDALRIELNDLSAAILAKYKDDDLNAPALPGMSNQKMNDYLKELAKLAKIDTPVRRIYWVKSERHEEVVPKYKVVTTHCGRRTFIVTALYLDIHTEVIRKWTGHKGDKAMRPYIAIMDKQKRENMAKFNTLLTASR